MPKGRVLIINNKTEETNILINIFQDMQYEHLVCDSLSFALESEASLSFDLAVLSASTITGGDAVWVEELMSTHKMPILFVGTAEKNNKFIIDKKDCIERPIEVNTVRTQIQNVLRLKAVQDELNAEKEKFAQVFELTSNEMILTDLNYNILAQNNKILSKDVFKYTNFVELIKDRGFSEHIEQIDAFLCSSEKLLNLRFVFDGLISVKATISKIFKENKPTMFLIVLEDFSHEVEKMQMRSCFIDMLNHHLKTPVRAEKRVLRLLLENSFGSLTEEQNDIVQEMHNSSRFMLHMIDNVLTMFKLNSEDFSLNKSTNSINQTIQSSVENLNYMFKTKNQSVKIYSYIDENKDYIFDYDEIEIKRVLENLIANAAEHSPKSSEISILIKRESDFVKISVRDQGVGIPQDSLNNILNDCWYEQRFKKVGSGLGLYITKKIIELHGGELSISSNTASLKGTDCTFSLPCVEKNATALV